MTHPEIVAELKKIPYTWTTENKGIGTIAASMLETGEPTNVYEALLAVYSNILGIEENRLENTRQINTPEVTEGLPVRTGDTRQSTGESEPSVQVTDGGTGTGSNTSTEPLQNQYRKPSRAVAIDFPKPDLLLPIVSA